jgi:Tol biopolymer transport system component/imidazolonepropionase-like amidohydrolase
MIYRNSLPIVLFLLLPLGLLAQKDKKWDVNNPEGLPYKDIEFTTTEGTWMNLDVSPDGQTLAFDLLGDIYTMPVSGGQARCLRAGIAWEVQPRFSPDGKQILFTSDAGGGDNIWVMNTDGNKARQVTKESFRLLNNAVWMPDGQYFVARKHFTSTRSLGAGEMWMYHISGGDGLQLTKRKNDQQDVNEPCVSPDGRYVYFSEDMYGGGYFQYNKDPLKQIFEIRRYDRQEGKIEDITGGSGGAVRPQISPDGKLLAFVRRVDVKSVLFIRDLESGMEYPLYDGLDKDQQEAWTIFGIYPGFAWMPAYKDFNYSLVIWAGGKIKKLGLHSIYLHNTKAYKEFFPVTEIPFSCQVKTKVAETLRFKNKVFESEFTVRAVRNAITSPDGKTMIFNAAGKLYKKSLPDGKPELLVNTKYGHVLFGKSAGDDSDMLESEPCFSPDGKELVFVTWNDVFGGGLWSMNLASGALKQLPISGAIFRTPRFSPDGQTLAFRAQDGDDELGPSRMVKPGIYLLDMNKKSAPLRFEDLTFVTEEGENPQFSSDNKRIYVNTGGYLFGGLDKALISFDLKGQDRKVLFKSKYVNQWSPSPDGKWLAFTELHKAYICAIPGSGQSVDLSADTKSIPVAQVSKDAGYNLHWTSDSKNLIYTLGDEYYSIDLTNRFAFLPGAPDSLPGLPDQGRKIGLTLKADAPEGTVVFENARIITCEGDQVIENGVLEVSGNLITFVGKKSDYKKSKNGTKAYTSIDCSGKTIMPGMVDVHSHSGNFRFGLNPQKQWEYYANLAFGVTTMHDPSVNSEMAFSNAEMLKSGRMLGPRLFSTGTILYGADGDFKAPINSLDDARSTLRRTKAWGAFSVKSYNQPRREQRQQVIAAARELNMEVVPEGGSFFYHNLTQVMDGHSSIEHNIPVAPVYEDVIQFWKRTHTHNTPTLIVCYGAVNGEFYWYQKDDVWKNKRLLNFVPRHILDERSRHREMIPEEEYQNGHILVSKSLKKMQDNGININMGSHGQLQGLGAHWELWMLQQGGMSNLQAIKCATINGAVHLGMDQEIGSLKVGKLADLVVLDKNPLDQIRNSESIRSVMVNGRLYDAETLTEIGNYNRKHNKFWFELPGSQTNGSAGMTHSCTETKCVCGH